MPGGCQTCSAEGTPSNVRPVYSRAPSLKPGKLSGAGDDPLLRPAAGAPRPPRLARRGRHAADLGAVAGPRVRAAPDDDQGRAPEPDRQLARPLRLAGRVVGGDRERGGRRHRRLCRRRGAVRSVAAYAARAGLRSVSLVDGEPCRERLAGDRRDRGRRRPGGGRLRLGRAVGAARRRRAAVVLAGGVEPHRASDRRRPGGRGGVPHHRIRDRRAVRAGGSRPGGGADRAGRRPAGDLARVQGDGRLGRRRLAAADGRRRDRRRAGQRAGGRQGLGGAQPRRPRCSAVR